MNRQNSLKWFIALGVLAAGAGLGVRYWLEQAERHPAAAVHDKPPAAATTPSPAPVNRTAVADRPAGAQKMTLVQKIRAGRKPRRPDFSIQDINGRIRHIKEWNDKKVILLNFWATWCPPCKKEMPAFMELQEKYGKRGLQIIGIAIDDKELVKEFVDDMGINYVILSGQLDAVDISRRYGNFRGQLPYTVFINSKQQLVGVKRGEISKAEAEKAILQLLNTQ